MTNFDHCKDVLDGIYDVPLVFSKPPTILDIGANVGAFAVWADRRWPGCELICYEPVPYNFVSLKLNTGFIKNCSKFNVGVRLCAGQMQIAEGKHNCGEWTVKTGVNELTGKMLTVPCIAADQLPFAHIVKMDTEGCEVEILEGLKAAGRLNEPVSYLLEWHSEEDRLAIDALLKDKFILVGGLCEVPNRGTAKYIRRDVFKN